jgi:hypothetical protein
LEASISISVSPAEIAVTAPELETVAIDVFFDVNFNVVSTGFTVSWIISDSPMERVMLFVATSSLITLKRKQP